MPVHYFASLCAPCRVGRPSPAVLASIAIALTALVLAGCSGKEPKEQFTVRLEVDGQARFEEKASAAQKASAQSKKHLDTELAVRAACELARMMGENVNANVGGEADASVSSSATGGARPSVATESITASTVRVAFKPLSADPAGSAILNKSIDAVVCRTEKAYRGACSRDQRQPADLELPPQDHLALLRLMQGTHGMKAQARWESTGVTQAPAEKTVYRLRETLEMDLSGYTCISATISEKRT